MLIERTHRPGQGLHVVVAVLIALTTMLPLATVATARSTPGQVQPDVPVLLAPGGIAVILGQWSEMIQQAGAESGVPWQVIAAVLVVESGGDPEARSSAGAAGLMQVRPEHWQAYGGVFGSAVLDPWTNIRTGAAVLADAYARWGSWDVAIAAYTGAVDDSGAISSRVDDDGRTGAQYVDAVRNQAVSLGYVIPGTTLTGPEGAAQALRIAMSTVGTPYVWGGASYDDGGFDCSGLVLWAYNQVGATLPRTAAEQFDATTRIDPLSVKPGDLVFFVNTYGMAGITAGDGARTATEQRTVTHVGIYAGNGLMLHAPREGDYVRLTTLNSAFWRTHLAGYGRVE